MSYLVLISYIIFSSLGMVMVKYGGLNSHFIINKSSVNISINWIFAGGMALYFLSFVLWMIVLQKFQITYISPIAYGAMYICIAALSYFILHETLTSKQIIGIVMVVAGTLLCSITK